MLVYGDAVRRESVAQKLDEVRRYIAEATTATPWIVAHGLLVAALIEAGELAQGIADRAFEAAGQRDEPSEEADAAMALTLAIAEAVGRSWSEGQLLLDGTASPIARLAAKARDGQLTIKQPEGFAHYALYPETYWEAARPLRGTDLRVVGLRSIGTTLAAMVAAGAGAPCPRTVRPVGHPFGRVLALAEPLSVPAGAEVAIADEGPGLSGSSIAAAADSLREAGIEAARVHVFPSHANGPGPQASEGVRSFWTSARIRFRSFDDAVLGAAGSHSLVSWAADLTGAPLSELREITGGAWRDFRGEVDWRPPAHPWQEKRKFLLESRSGTWLLKFSGLGRIGLAKYERARALAQAGFTPEPLGFRHGFIVERWHGDAKPLDPHGPMRPRLLRQLGAYLAYRARHFSAAPDGGASSSQLFEMLRFNAEEEFGAELAATLESWLPHLPALDTSRRRIETDNRLHAWEWFSLPDGRILKADAVDHHAGHDLVGCQDVAWDIAGASLEFTLSTGEQRDLIERIEQLSNLEVDRAQVRFATLCYPAFQLGSYREATASGPFSDGTARLNAAAERYSARLYALLLGEIEPNTPSED